MLTRPAEPPDAVVRYADHADGLIDLFLPHRAAATGRPTRPCPLVVAVHGGFWQQEWDRTHLRPLANAMVDRGFAVATPEYRRGPAGWPRTQADITSSLEHVAGLVEGVAPGLVDTTTPYILTGHSAGGHLALWGGLRAGATRVRRIVALAPVADLIAAARSGMGEGAVATFMGAGPDEMPDAYEQADPMPLLKAPAGGPGIVIVQGTEDSAVPVDANRAVAVALTDQVAYVELEGADHFALIDPLSKAFTEAVLPRLH